MVEARIRAIAVRDGKCPAYVIIDLVDRALRSTDDAAKRDQETEWSKLAHDDLVSASQASRCLGLAMNTLAKMRVSGTGPPYEKHGGRLVLYHAGDIDDYRKQRLKRSASEYQVFSRMP